MSSLLQQLENNEAILLMYLADELPEADRVEVEAMLQTDANLAAELDRLRAVHERVAREVHALDRADALPPQQVAMRSIRSAMAQWVADREREAASIDQKRRRGLPWWGYPIAAAAMVGLILLIWWGALPANPTGYPADGSAPMAIGPDTLPEEEEFVEDDPDTLLATVTLEQGLLQDEMASLRETEQELAALQALSLEGSL
jgi:hypothetical protein